MDALIWIMLIIGGFLTGSIMFCAIIPKLFLHKDICEISDDGNPGAFNVFKHCDVKVGVLCLALDVLKGFVPVLLASLFTEPGGALFTLVMIAPVLGHAVGMFNRFHGGKCIATSFGVMLGLLPVTWIGLAVLADLYIFFSVAIKLDIKGLRSIVVYVLFLIITSIIFGIIGMGSVAAGCAFIAIIAVVKHLMQRSLAQRSVSENE